MPQRQRGTRVMSWNSLKGYNRLNSIDKYYKRESTNVSVEYLVTFQGLLKSFWGKHICHAYWPWSVRGSQGAISCHRDTLGVAVVDQFVLGQVWVALHLVGKMRSKYQWSIYTCIMSVNPFKTCTYYYYYYYYYFSISIKWQKKREGKQLHLKILHWISCQRTNICI